MNSKGIFFGFLAVCGVVIGMNVMRSAGPKLPPPAVFTLVNLSQARSAIAEKGKQNPAALLVVKATAAWCGPCKQMDRTTFRDPTVEAWFKDNGILVPLDVDVSPKDAKALNVRAMPTMIVFNAAGNELDRSEGGMDAKTLVGWLDQLKAKQSQAPAPTPATNPG
jgi:thiol:disulfide interchange protein